MTVKLVAIAVLIALAAAACGAEDALNDARDTVTEAVDEAVEDGEVTDAVENGEDGDTASDADIAAQRTNLAEATIAAGHNGGPQAPRDIDSREGSNPITFTAAPHHTEMNLCDIHFHESAEHKGGQFTTHAGNGDGKGNGTGYVSDIALTEAQLAPFAGEVGKPVHGDLVPGDTIEIHYVYTTAKVAPAPGLGSCLVNGTQDEEPTPTPLLRVEAQVYVLVNDGNGHDLREFTEFGDVEVGAQVRIPSLGEPVEYAGSTTGPGFNQEPSPLLVTWSVHPAVLEVSIGSVAEWLEHNDFNEHHAHAVRNLVINPELLSPIG